ncbi:DUF4179 domain-containing protein [Sedimentibacter sp. zth1]|uniref:DUF4179 domain-containing protein n=1 Tax=Sedimentibacter sp. zth1 TaxID=2816908 RepID=UPI001A90D681|nr:DUF4179 domain-containing protein [Sedimentibacter sp. zth1]QSX06905.1 DUF4179 domain-containing protein [Sedimentibacter sp. zth1]
MNRENEFTEILTELDSIPKELDNIELNTLDKYKKNKNVKKMTLIPLGSVACILLIFTLLINTSMTIAFAISDITVLKDISRLLTFSPSIKSAVENDYIQYINIGKTQNDITVTIDYLIVDEQQLNIFYTITSDKYKEFQSQTEFSTSDANKKLKFGFTDISEAYSDYKNTGNIVFDFSENNRVNENLIFKFTVKERENKNYNRYDFIENNNSSESNDIKNENIITEISLPLKYDTSKIAKTKTIMINKEIIIENQKMTILSADITPTKLNIKFSCDNENSSIISGLKYYLIDNCNNKYDKISNGTVSKSDLNRNLVEIRAESPYFYKCEQLKLVITDVSLIEKNKQKVEINLNDKGFEVVKDYIRYENYANVDGYAFITFSAPVVEGHFGQIGIGSEFYDKNNNECTIIQVSHDGGGYFDFNTNENIRNKDRLFETVVLDNFTGNTIYVYPNFTTKAKFSNPISIDIIYN